MASTDPQRAELPQHSDRLFARVAANLEEYFKHVQAHLPEAWDEGLAREAGRVLWQIEYATVKIRESLAKSFEIDLSAGIYGPVKRDDDGRIVSDPVLAERLSREGLSSEAFFASDETDREVIFFVEAFYRCAFRFKEVAIRLPGLTNFNPPGIRNVRNWLIEHPERQPITSWGWATDSKNGPRLRPGRTSREAWDPQDAGLWPNLAQFEEALTRVLRSCIEQR
jgi:hypothetical protein